MLREEEEVETRSHYVVLPGAHRDLLVSASSQVLWLKACGTTFSVALIFNPPCPSHWDHHYIQKRSHSFHALSLELPNNSLCGQGEQESIGVGIYLRESVDTGEALAKEKEGAGNRSESALWIGANTFPSHLLCKIHLSFLYITLFNKTNIYGKFLLHLLTICGVWVCTTQWSHGSWGSNSVHQTWWQAPLYLLSHLTGPNAS